MKFCAQRNLLSMLAKRVDGALGKSTNLMDPAQYLALEAGDERLTAMVARPEIIARATLDAGKLPGKEFLEISSPGSCVLDGETAVPTMSMGDPQERVTAEFKPGKKPKAKEGEEPTLDETGMLLMTSPGVEGIEERHGLTCVDLPRKIKIDLDPSSKMTLRASDLLRYVKLAGIATGEPDPSYDGLLLRARDGKVEMVTATKNQIVVSTFEAEAPRKACFILSYDLVSMIAGMLDPEADVEVYSSPAGGKRQVVFRQGILFGGAPVGESLYALTPLDKFVKFDAILSLDSPFSCKANKQHAQMTCAKLGILKVVKTEIVFDPARKVLVFTKHDVRGSQKIPMPMSDVKGDKLELAISSRHLKAAVDLAEQDEIELRFSGRHSLAVVVIAPNVREYFAPFGEA